MSAPDDLTEREKYLIERYGDFHRALNSGKHVPQTDAQQRFVNVLRGKASPETEHEIAFTKFIRRVRWERENRPKPPEDPYYIGIITQTKVERAEIGLAGRSPGNAFDLSALLALPPGSPGQRPISGHGSLCLGYRPISFPVPGLP